METLFEIETERLCVRWQGPPRHPCVASDGMQPGRLRVVPRRPGERPRVLRYGVPPEAQALGDLQEGPRLFEETQYHLWAYSKDGSRVRVGHRDPALLQGLAAGPRLDVVAGTVNFHGQVGRSLFTVELDGVPQVEFEVEVFPSKLDYKSDYAAMLAEVSHFMTALALEYLRATYRLGEPVRAPSPAAMEWLTLLRFVLDQLEQALRQIERRPARRLAREPRLVRPERCRRLDSALRHGMERGQGSGGWMRAGAAGPVREYVLERRPVESVDTPEHRWLRAQLAEIRNRVAGIAREEKEKARELGVDGRAQAALDELHRMESRIAGLLRVEPIALARGEPPAGFSSLLLQGGPGYREACRAVLTLRLGLRLEGGPLQLSLKDISTLYEYWCYLAILEILREELGARINPADLLKVTSRGLQVDLERGRAREIKLAGGRPGRPRLVTVTYNRTYKTPTGHHRPDVSVAIEVEGWRAPFEILLDAKYRVDASAAYVERHRTPGPPEDAVNALHRYRDAILDRPPDGEGPPRHRIIMGAALFPLQDPEGAFKANTFHASLGRVGIGALPFLPSQRRYVQAWLHDVIRKSGWSIADRAIQHRAVEERWGWQREASEAVLIAVLRPGVGHLDWVRENRLYYAPLHRLGRRRFLARWVAFYRAKGDEDGPGAITHEAQVLEVSVERRSAIPTPWPPRDPDELCVVYHLGELTERTPPISVPHGIRFFRWASRLSLSRARRGDELYLETEPEWRLYDELAARGVAFSVRPGSPGVVDPDDVKGRANFEAGGRSIRYEGAAGFRISQRGESISVPRVMDVIRRLDPGAAPLEA